jgi:hypothetical protein
MNKSWFLAAALTGVGYALTGYSATNYVDRTRPDDSGDGLSWATAKRTIQAAVTVAAVNDTVLVAPGTYDEGMTVTPGGYLSNRVVVTKSIILQSRDGAATTVIQGAKDYSVNAYGCGTNAVRCVYMSSGTLKGFTLTGGATSPDGKQSINDRGGGLYGPNTSTPAVYDCILSNNASLRGGGAFGGALHRCLITGNFANNNSSGLRESRAYDCLIVNNTGPSAIGYTRDTEGIVNCTIARNSNTALDNTKAYNCIITENGGNVANSSELVANCCISSTAGVTTGSNNIVTADARFVDSANGDFRLLPTSPCLNIANTNFYGLAGPAATRTDYLGSPRLQGAGLDLGALEGAASTVAIVTAAKQGTGAGTVTPTNRCALATFPTQLVFTATAGAGSALRHFTVNGAKMADCGDTFTLTVTRPGTNHVAAVFYPARYVDASAGDDANDGAAPATAWRTLQFAADTAPVGTLVLAAPGVYHEGAAYFAAHSNRVAITRNVVLKGSAGASQTVIAGARDLVTGNAYGCGTGAVRCVYMNTGALEGFTLAGGASSVSVNDADGDLVRGGALYSAGLGTEIWDCVLSNNVASRGSAAWGGSFHRCLVAENRTSNAGNGLFRTAYVYDSLLVRNVSGWQAAFGGVRLYNCTVADNTGGGISAGVLAYNTILYNNSGTEVENNSAILTNCCTGASLRPGEGNIMADPLFVAAANGDYRLLASSPCVNAGNTAYLQSVDGTDYDGDARVQGGQVNMGALESAVSSVTASSTSGGAITPEGTFLFSSEVTFTATPWPGRAFRYFETNGAAVAGSDTNLTINAADFGNAAVTVRAVFQDGFYVDAASGDDGNSGLEANVPFRTLQAAADLALAGDTIRVSPGVYADGGAPVAEGGLTNRLVLTNAVTVVSLGGAEATVIVGARSQNATGCGADAVRCVRLAAGCTLQGFTLTGGSTDIAGGPTGEDYGGGAHVASGTATLIDCIISNNLAYTKGGGVSMATLHRCLVADNALADLGGFGSGVRGGAAYDSVIVGNSAPYPVAYADLHNVTCVHADSPVSLCNADNSIILRTDGGNSYISSDTSRKVYNSCLTGTINPVNSGGNNLYGVDPLFIAPEARDFRIHANSPCVDSGDVSRGTGRLGFDYAGAERVQGATVDRGAYEGGVGGLRVVAGVSGGGDVSPSGLHYYALPATAVFAAAPWPGRAFTHFSTNGVAIPYAGDSIDLSTTVSKAVTLTAHFAGTLYADASRPDDSGDGLSWATAKRTLQAAVDLTAAHDTVLAAPGVYAEGTRVTPNEKTVGALLNRVAVTNAITLRSRDGAAETVIRGAFDTGSGDPFGRGPNAVRCVYLGKGALEGFTLTGGATDSVNLENENNRGGGVYVPENNYTQLVLDCVISNCASVRGGGMHAGTIKRCILRDNYAQNNSSALRGSFAYDCLVAQNRTGGSPTGSAVGYGWCYNCTVSDNEGRSGDNASFYNSILTGYSVSGRHFDCCIAGGTGGAGTTNDNCFADAPLFADADYRLAVGSPCIDRANRAYVADAFGTDLDGALRMMNARVDVGAYEWDWRPAFAADLDGAGVTVTEVTPFVTHATNAAYAAGSAVYLDGAAALADQQATVAMTASWQIPFGRTVLLSYEVTGNGTLALYEGAALIGTATAAAGPVTLKYATAAQTPCLLRFVYTPAAGDPGGALVDAFAGTGGLLLLLH